MAQFTAQPRWCFSESTADPVPSRCGSLEGLLRLVAETGLPVPREFAAVRDRLAIMNQAVADSPLTDRLVAAVLDGDGDIAVLLGLASTQPAIAVIERVQQEAFARLRGLWPSRCAYAALAGQFDSCAKRFTDLARQVDIGARAEDVVVADRREQKAWHQAPAVAQELDASLARLSAAAEIARGVLPRRIGTSDESLYLPLVISNVGELHVRRLYEAWNMLSKEIPPSPALTKDSVTRPRQHPLKGRAGRWQLLLTLGAKIAAHPNPSALELLSPPRQFHHGDYRRAHRPAHHTQGGRPRRSRRRATQPTQAEASRRASRPPLRQRDIERGLNHDTTHPQTAPTSLDLSAR